MAMTEVDRLRIEVRADQDQAWSAIQEILLEMPPEARADLVERAALAPLDELGPGEVQFLRLCAVCAIVEAGFRIEGMSDDQDV